MRFLLIQTLLLMIAWSPPAQAAAKRFWFPVGEKLLYRLYWGIIPVGWAELSTEWVREGAGQLIALRVAARTSSIVDMIYPVDDFIESVVDPETFLPLRYVQRLREGRHVRDDQIIFNHKGRKAHWKSGIDGRTGEIEIAPDSRDVLCLIYYMRSKGFACGQKEKFRVLVDNKLYDLEVTGLKQEEVSVQDFGKVQCLKVEPKAKFGEIFVRKGHIRIWFSEDDRHICTIMTGKIPVVSVKAILVGVEGPGDDFWSKGRR